MAKSVNRKKCFQYTVLPLFSKLFKIIDFHGRVWYNDFDEVEISDINL